jgi:G6PDH family F420-dependent oxidoreductase
MVPKQDKEVTKMPELGYALSSEEHPPRDLVRYAVAAEEAGFRFALISDHFHPWTEAQGQSPFVWSVIGAIAQATERLVLGTGVTCPTVRVHPAIIAQAAATSASLMPGRFFLGVGSGEALNEHILGDPWPPVETRLEMLEEAVGLIRDMWKGEDVTHYGDYFTVTNARIYTVPDSPPPIMFAAGGKTSAALAGRLGDGLIATAPDEKVIRQFDENGGSGKPKIGQSLVCWAATEEEGVKTAMDFWPNAALGGELGQELPMPAHYEQATKLVREEDIKSNVVCGPDPDRHIARAKEYIDAGFDYIYVHQIGPDQQGFFRFYQREVMPNLPLSEAPAVLAR